ncbi:hypothetical protein MBLNU459_g6478t1 [Dothideomycetes sp. NU459]
MSQETLRNLETLRQRLNNLATSLGKLRHDLETNDPLPSWPSLQNSSTLLSHNLASLHATLSNAQPLLASAHVFPLPSFPGRAQEDLLGQLLRKKLQPGVEDWIEQGGVHAGFLASSAQQQQQQQQQQQSNGTGIGSVGAAPQTALSGDEWEDLWNWAGPEGNKIAREMGEDAFNDVFTLAEQEDGIDAVVTGLRRKMWESEDEDDDDNDDETKLDKEDKMDVDIEAERVPEAVRKMQRADVDETRPMLSLELLLRFASTGVEPQVAGNAQIRR